MLLQFWPAAILLTVIHPKEEAMSTDSIVDFLIALIVIMVVALQVQILQLKKTVRTMSGGVPKS